MGDFIPQWVRSRGSGKLFATNALAQAVEGRSQKKGVRFCIAGRRVGEGQRSAQRSRGIPPNGVPCLPFVTLTENRSLVPARIDGVGSSCSSLDDSMVFVVSVLIESRRCARENDPSSGPPPPHHPLLRKSSVRQEASWSGRPPSPWRFGANVESRVGGLLPAWGRCDGGGVARPPGFWGIQLSGTSWLRASVSADRGARSDLQLAYGGLALCPFRLEIGRFSYRACAGVEVGSLQSRGVGFDRHCRTRTSLCCIFCRVRFDFGWRPFGCQPRLS